MKDLHHASDGLQTHPACMASHFKISCQACSLFLLWILMMLVISCAARSSSRQRQLQHGPKWPSASPQRADRVAVLRRRRYKIGAVLDLRKLGIFLHRLDSPFPQHGIPEHLLGRVNPLLVCGMTGDGGLLSGGGQVEGLVRRWRLVRGRHLHAQREARNIIVCKKRDDEKGVVGLITMQSKETRHNRLYRHLIVERTR